MPIQISHSEVDARAKWCPFARAHWSVGEGQPAEYQGNRFFKEDGVTPDTGVSCLGSGCMAWRWVETHVPGPMKDDGAADLVPSSNTHGYCGLAGDPRLGLR